MKVKFKLKSEKLEELKTIISDLCKIDKQIKIKVSEGKFSIYSSGSIGERKANSPVLALKYFFFDKEEFLYLEEDVDFDWVIGSGTTLNKKLSFLDTSKDIVGTLNASNMKGSNYVSNVLFTDGKLKFTLSGQDPMEIKDIKLSQLNSLTDVSNSITKFSVNTDDFNTAKSLVNIETDEIISITLNNNKTLFRQSSWELEVGTNDYESSKTISFNKKYLKSITNSQDINWIVFPTFLLFKEDNQTFMVSYEQDFSQ